MSTIDQQFVEYIIKSLVEHPDDVIVERLIDEKGVLLTLTVNPEDLGRVIGKRGGTAQSVRTLLRALGTKNDARYNLKIVNNDGFTGSQQQSQSDDDAIVDNSTDEPVESGSSYAENARKELAELDDLDI
ncbi:MAG: KH domain-containing protein [Candidatus Saccharibacteria bacterium]|nr:KH domain-containing protein [Candidatus Saccharibacteria bacterium]